MHRIPQHVFIFVVFCVFSLSLSLCPYPCLCLSHIVREHIWPFARLATYRHPLRQVSKSVLFSNHSRSYRHIIVMSPVPKGLVKIFTSTTVTLKGVHIMHSLKNTKYWQRAAGAFTSKAHSSQKLSFLDDDQIAGRYMLA